MAVGDIYQTLVKYRMPGGEESVNAYYWKVDSGTSTADDLNSAFADDIWDLARGLQNTGTITYSYDTVNGMDNDDYEYSSASDAGTSGGGDLACTFAAVSVRSPYLGVGKGYSYKRVGGIALGFFGTSDGSWNPTGLTQLEALQDAHGLLLEGDNASYIPIIITGGFKLGVNPTELADIRGSWTTNVFPSSQVTRKQSSWQRLDS